MCVSRDPFQAYTMYCATALLNATVGSLVCSRLSFFRTAIWPSGGHLPLCLVVFHGPHIARAYFAKMSVRKSTHLTLLVNTQKDELPPLNGGLLSGGGWKMWQDAVVGTARGCVRPPGRV